MAVVAKRICHARTLQSPISLFLSGGSSGPPDTVLKP